MIRSLPAVSATLFALVLVGCAAATPPIPAPAPTVTSTIATSSPPQSASTRAEWAVCTYGAAPELPFNLARIGWDTVRYSRGESDHAEMVGSLLETVKRAEGLEEPSPCKGAVERADLRMAVATLNLEVSLGDDDEGEDETYESIVDAGNAWFDAVGFTGRRFSH